MNPNAEGVAKEKSSHKAIREADEASRPCDAVGRKVLSEEGQIRTDWMAPLNQKQNCRRTNSATPECSYTGAESHSIKFRKRVGEDFACGRISKTQRAVTKTHTTIEVVSESPGQGVEGKLKSAFHLEESEEGDLQQNEQDAKQ